MCSVEGPLTGVPSDGCFFWTASQPAKNNAVCRGINQIFSLWTCSVFICGAHVSFVEVRLSNLWTGGTEASSTRGTRDFLIILHKHMETEARQNDVRGSKAANNLPHRMQGNPFNVVNQTVQRQNCTLHTAPLVAGMKNKVAATPQKQMGNKLSQNVKPSTGPRPTRSPGESVPLPRA